MTVLLYRPLSTVLREGRELAMDVISEEAQWVMVAGVPFAPMQNAAWEAAGTDRIACI